MKTFNELEIEDPIYFISSNDIDKLIVKRIDHHDNKGFVEIFTSCGITSSYIISLKSMKDVIVDYGWFVLISDVNAILKYINKTYGISKDL